MVLISYPFKDYDEPKTLVKQNCRAVSKAVTGYNFGLSVGAIAAYTTTSSEACGEWSAKSSVGGFSILAIFAVYVSSLGSPEYFVWNLAMSFFGALLVANMWMTKGYIASHILGTPVLAYLGRLSYSMYLIHVLIINFTVLAADRAGFQIGFWSSFAVSYVITFFASALLHRYFEKPITNLGRRVAASVKEKDRTPERKKPAPN